MSKNWKAHLKTYLKDGSEKDLKVFLRQEWLEIFPEEKEKIYQFLWQTKLNKLFIHLMAIDLQNHLLEMPWTLFLQILIESKVKLTPEAHQELNQIFMSQKMIDTQKSNLAELLSSLKNNQRNAFFTKLHKIKQELVSSSQIAKSERLMDQHIHFINELKKYFPSEQLSTSLITDQEKNKAEAILKKRLRQKTKSYNSTPIDTEAVHFIEKIQSQSSSLLKKGKGKATDFAYLLRSLGDSEKAIDFINSTNDSEQRDWQLLDYLFHAKQYLSVLDHCSLLKRKYAKNPDSLFSIFYTEALSYWELGEREKALDLMNQISTMRPDFKSASEILSYWKDEPFE